MALSAPSCSLPTGAVADVRSNVAIELMRVVWHGAIGIHAGTKTGLGRYSRS